MPGIHLTKKISSCLGMWLKRKAIASVRCGGVTREMSYDCTDKSTYNSVEEIFKAHWNNLVEEIAQIQWNAYRSHQGE